MLHLIPSALSNTTFDRLWRDMDRLMNTSSGQFTAPASAMSNRPWPGLNVWRDGERIVAEAEIPGFRMEEVEVFATEDSLTLRGRRTETAPEGATPLRIERCVRDFERSLRLPTPIDPEGVEASLVDGVLRVTMPVAPAARPRRIAIRAAGA